MKKLISRWIHAVVALVVVVVLFLSLYFVPDLHKDKAILFGTVGGFATIYGVLFAIVEVMRTQAVAVLTEEASKKVLGQVEGLHGMTQIAECQAAIGIATDMIDRGEEISLAALTQIVKMYSLKFHCELQNAESEQRANIAILQSYATVKGNSRGSKTALGNLSKALMDMTGHLSCATATTTKGVN